MKSIYIKISFILLTIVSCNNSDKAKNIDESIITSNSYEDTTIINNGLTKEKDIKVIDKPNPVKRVRLSKHDIKYNEDMIPRYDFTVTNEYDKTVVAFEIGYNFADNVKSVKKFKTKIQPKNKYSSSISLKEFKDESPSYHVLETATYRVTKVVFSDGTINTQ